MRSEQSEIGSDGKNEEKFSVPTISLSKGGGAIRGIGEKFAANPVTGTGTMTVPIAASPGRSGFGPQLSLSYDSGSGNGPFGFGWALNLPQITRKTDKGLPQYRDAEESDVFILSGTEDLVPGLRKGASGELEIHDDPRTIGGVGYRVRRYGPRIEGLFARIERWTNVKTGEIHWRSISKDNITTLYGKDNNSRIFDSAELDITNLADVDKAHPKRVFAWLICQSYDDKGNIILYKYKSEDSDRIFEDKQGKPIAKAHERNRDDITRSVGRYLKQVQYGNRVPYLPILSEDERWPLPPGSGDQDVHNDWLFEIVLDYGEHDNARTRGPDLAQSTATVPQRNGSHTPMSGDERRILGA